MSKKTDPQMSDKKKEKTKKNVKSASDKRKSSTQQVPLMLDVVYNFSIIFVVVVGAMVAALSLVAGVDLINTALRTGITILLLGFGLIGLFWYLSKTSLDSAMNEMKEYLKADEQDEIASSTMEVKA